MKVIPVTVHQHMLGQTQRKKNNIETADGKSKVTRNPNRYCT